jgi:hypothetical protein
MPTVPAAVLFRGRTKRINAAATSGAKRMIQG